ARLVPICKQPLRLDPQVGWYAPHYLNGLGTVLEEVDSFDVLHSHLDIYSFPLAHLVSRKLLVTCHGRLDLSDLFPLYRRYRRVPMVSVSDSQRLPMPWANWVATVYHGLPLESYPLGSGSGGYLAFLGRVSREKRLDLAIEVARRTGIPLKVAAKIDKMDKAYFEEKIAPLMDDPLVEYIGEIDDSQKPAFLGGALALLMPVDWPEPFGLVNIEAMACGTPVVARPCGSLPEVVRHGVTGYLAERVEDMAAAVERLDRIRRADCREHVAINFTTARMAREYEAVYEALTSKPRRPLIKSAA
ncbi:MAG: glycosyltransferase family 4 protein, partial [Nitrospinota bacterium]